MKANYDKIADALYLRIKKGVVKHTIRMKDMLLVDADKKGNIIGIEILNASSQFSSKNKKQFVESLTEGIPVKIASVA